ncbi:MAG TPA: GapA-binding peptide SR1P [Bacillota bacterium]|nr:GapA-binding peptide SR1P [Bacillota bacterium]
MTILVCQDCDKTIDFMKDEKVSVLYGKCGCCSHEDK